MQKTISLPKINLLEKKQALTAEYLQLEEIKKCASTVISCQTKKNEAGKRQKEIEKELYKLEGKLLEESEGYGLEGYGEKEMKELKSGKKNLVKKFLRNYERTK